MKKKAIQVSRYAMSFDLHLLEDRLRAIFAEYSIFDYKNLEMLATATDYPYF
jgi:hypothetical protein